MSQIIAVTGSTGKLGQLVVKELLKVVAPEQIVAVARRPEAARELFPAGVQVRQGDYARPETIKAAFEGVDRALLISSSEVGQRAAQHQGVIDAAKAQGVSLLAYTSLLRCDSSPLILGQEHQATEEALAASGVPTVILRNGWYIENYTENLAPALEHGTFIGSAGEGRVAAATRADFAKAAVAVLTGEGHQGKTYELNGDTGFTMKELAQAVSQWAGREIGYLDMPQSDYQGALAQAGVPGPFAQILADSDVGIKNGALDVVGDDLSTLIGGPTTTVQQVLANIPTPKA